MNKLVKIKYSSEVPSTEIYFEEKSMDVSRIKGRKIEEWAYPFIVKNIRWNGICDELKEFTDSDELTVQFIGTDKEMEILKDALKNTNVKVAGTNNKVVILYTKEPLSTKITVNGKIFDTSKIQNRSIDEWIYPFQFREIKWNGIFKELENYLNTDFYSIQFVGEQDDVKELMSNCPDNVDITFRSPVSPSGMSAKTASASGTKGTLENLRQNFNGKNISEIAGGTLSKMSQEITDDEINKNLQNIPIKNEFIRKNIMAICALLSIFFAVFPFIKSATETSSEYTGSDSVSITLTGFTALFGSHGSLVTIILFIGPLFLILMNYITQLKPYRRIIAVVIPALCIIFEVIVFFVLKDAINAGTGVVSSAVAEFGVEQNTSVTPQIGFFLLLISYILTAVVGFITYYGLQLPVKKSKGE